MKRPSVLIVDDEREMRDTCLRIVQHMGYKGKAIASAEDAIYWLNHHPYDIIVVDLRLPGMSGMDLLHLLNEQYPKAATVVITAYGSVVSDLEAAHHGAIEYLTKPFTVDQFKCAIRQAWDMIDSGEPTSNGVSLEDLQNLDIIGNSPRFKDVLEKVCRIAPSDTTVLIEGQSGTGKEVIARALHRFSSRSDQPFIPVDCGTIPANLLEAELFGYEKGAFTGASSTRKGLIEEAHKGTLFLDEISNLPLALQPKLLRVLQEKVFRRISGNREITADFRIIAATNRSIAKLIQEGAFREDLYYRLRVVELKLPPLIDRKEDIPVLADYFFHHFRSKFRKTLKGISQATYLVLHHYPWPGNIRELKNAIEHAMALSRGPVICPLDLPSYILDSTSFVQKDRSLKTFHDQKRRVLQEFEFDYLVQLLDYTQGNVSKAAKLACLRRSSLYKMIQRHGIHVDRFRQKKYSS